MKHCPVAVDYNVETREWRLMASQSVHFRGHIITAARGYTFDLASIPRPFWRLIAPYELSIIAPLFHDLLYEYRGRLADGHDVVPHHVYTRREADELFRHLMRVAGVAWWRRVLAYAVVRLCGGVYWRT